MNINSVRYNKALDIFDGIITILKPFKQKISLPNKILILICHDVL